MTFTCRFKIGETVTNQELYTEFQCANMGGMRRSKATNTLVLVTDHTRGLYEDKWFGNILHYTGIGKVWDQDIDRAQNKTLAESKINGVELHLFEVLERSEYIYRGIVELADKPYQEVQEDEDGNKRKVWMFPVKLKDTL